MPPVSHWIFSPRGDSGHHAPREPLDFLPAVRKSNISNGARTARVPQKYLDLQKNDPMDLDPPEGHWIFSPRGENPIPIKSILKVLDFQKIEMSNGGRGGRGPLDCRKF